MSFFHSGHGAGFRSVTVAVPVSVVPSARSAGIGLFVIVRVVIIAVTVITIFVITIAVFAVSVIAVGFFGLCRYLIIFGYGFGYGAGVISVTAEKRGRTYRKYC